MTPALNHTWSAKPRKKYRRPPARYRDRRRLKTQRHHQCPRRSAMCHGDGFGVDLGVPLGHALLDLEIALAAWRRHRPLLGLTLGKQFGVGSLHLGKRRTFPAAVPNLTQPVVDSIVIRRQFQ